MAINPDFSDLFAALNDAGARYLLVGGYALAVHGVPRFTKDLDVWTDPTRQNAALVITALRAFGAPMDALVEGDLAQPGVVFQIGVPPNRIDIVTAIDGVTFAEAWPARVITTYGDRAIEARVMGPVDLAHPAFAKLVEHPVSTEHPAGLHPRGIMACRRPCRSTRILRTHLPAFAPSGFGEASCTSCFGGASSPYK